MICLYILFTLILCLNTAIEVSRVSEFVDTFSLFDAANWMQEHDVLSCLFNQCFYALVQKLDYLKVDVRGEPHSWLNIKLENTCKGQHCCHFDEFCTYYEGGQIMSRKSYLYGSFRFVAMADSTFAFACVFQKYLPQNDV